MSGEQAGAETATDADAAGEILQPAPGRECGPCSLCCKVFHVAELNKAAGVWCKEAAPGRGCKIHATRPQICRSFFCEWMLDASLGPEWKPDRAKFAISLLPGGVNLLIAMDPSFPENWRREPYFTQIRHWVSTGAAVGKFVFVRTGRRCLAVLPDGEQALGDVGPDDGLVVARIPGPAGYRYRVQVQRAQT